MPCANMSDGTEFVDEVTGEVYLEPDDKFLAAQIAGHPPDLEKIDLKTLEDEVNRIGDKISSKLERAKRFREQAERRAKPLELSAKWLLQQIEPHVKLLAEARLPRYQSGAKVGQFSKKTLELETCRFAFKKDGGTWICDKKAAITFILNAIAKHPELEDFLGNEVTLDDKGLLSWVTKQPELEPYLGFVASSKVNELAKVSCEVD